MSETIHNTALKYLSDKIKIILVDDLGKYQIIKNGGTVASETAAIRVIPPELPSNYRIKEASGIEALINRETELNIDSMMGAHSICEKYCIKLTQYNLNKSIKTSVLKILSFKEWEIFDNPIIMPFQEIGEGYVYPQAIIKISVDFYQKFS